MFEKKKNIQEKCNQLYQIYNIVYNVKVKRKQSGFVLSHGVLLSDAAAE